MKLPNVYCRSRVDKTVDLESSRMHQLERKYNPDSGFKRISKSYEVMQINLIGEFN